MYENPPRTRKRRHRGVKVYPLMLLTALLGILVIACNVLPITGQGTNCISSLSETQEVTEAAATVPENDGTEPETDEIDAAADAVLDTILWDGASTKEQVYAIYSWARTRLSYGGRSEHTDWRQTAYTVLQEGRCDCYGYFAVTKLFFERLGIPNIDVQKVKNSEDDSDHFWSLVSVDGGETYYHFDATPRIGEGDDFCLVTDAFLDDYSASHKGSHNRDKSLYPATPEEAPK